MAEKGEAQKTYNYASIANEKNRDFDRTRFLDLGSIEIKPTEYDSGQTLTKNIIALLKGIYRGDTKTSYHHAFDIFRTIDDQCVAAGLGNGLDDFEKTIKENCTQVEIVRGEMRFLDADGKPLRKFNLTTQKTDQDPRAAERSNRAHEIAVRAKALLDTVFGDLPSEPLKLPKFGRGARFRLHPELVKQTGFAPKLLDPRGIGESILCARWATAFLRQYLGQELVKELGLTEGDAWEIKQRLQNAVIKGAPEGAPAVTVDASLNQFLEIRGNQIVLAPPPESVQSAPVRQTPAPWIIESLRPIIGDSALQRLNLTERNPWEIKSALIGKQAATVVFSLDNLLKIRGGHIIPELVGIYPRGRRKLLQGDAAMAAPYFKLQYRKFYTKAAATSDTPQIITLYDPATQNNADIIAANSKNSLAVINLGQGEKTIVKPGDMKSPQPVSDVIWSTILKGGDRKLDWLLSEKEQGHASKVYLKPKDAREPEQLKYRAGVFYRADGSAATVGPDDTLLWKDIMVANELTKGTAVNGLAELMIRNRYIPVDLLQINQPYIAAKPAEINQWRDNLTSGKLAESSTPAETPVIPKRGEDIKNSEWYKLHFRQFLASAARITRPPGIITLYYRHTQSRKAIISANREQGVDSRNSHVVVNLGNGMKPLLKPDALPATAPPEEATKMVWRRLASPRRNLDWMFIEDPATNGSRIYLQAQGTETPQQLFYRDKKFYNRDGSLAMVGHGDALFLKDVLIADKFHHEERVMGLTELMISDKYELVDLINFNQAAIPQKRIIYPQVPPYRVQQLAYLQRGETLNASLQSSGIPADQIPLHLYAYEKAGIDTRKLRPFDPLPLFDSGDIEKDIQSAGGLDKARAKVRTAEAQAYMQHHPGEYLFVITPEKSPAKLATEILKLPILASLGRLTGPEMQKILMLVSAANRDFKIEAGKKGEIIAAHRYNTGEAVYVTDAFLGKIRTHIEAKRAQTAVYIPEHLPGKKRFKAVTFSPEEIKLIENTTPDPDVRRALALIFAKEQKQKEGLSRKTGKFVLEHTPDIVMAGLQKLPPTDQWPLLGQIPQFKKIGKFRRPTSVGSMQIRPQKAEVMAWAAQNGIESKSYEELYELYREKLMDDPVENMRLAAERVGEIFDTASKIYQMHGEHFDPKKPGCMAFVLNTYNAAIARVLNNTLNVWVTQMEGAIGIGTGNPESMASQEIADRYGAIARKLKEKGELDLTDQEIGDGVATLAAGARIPFLQSTLLAALEKWHNSKSGKTLSLNIEQSVIDNPLVRTKYLYYGVSAAYVGLAEIEKYSTTMRQQRREKDLLAEG